MRKRDYPYMYARVSAKRAKLLDSSDYENLLKMGPNEISRKLEEGAYQEDINELGSRHEGVELVELALSRNLAREMSELVEMADGKLQKVIQIYLRKYDILTFKRILRAKKAGQEQNIEDYLTPVGGLSHEKIEELSDKDYDEVKNSINFENSLVDYQSYIANCGSSSSLENCLDQAYYDELDKLADKVGSSNLRKFVVEEVEYENLKIALRLKKYDLPEEKIRERLLASRNGKLVEEILNKQYKEALEHVVNELGLEVNERLEEIEQAIEVHRLENALRMLHTQPLSLSFILGYVVAKITEVKNLRMLLRAKETGIQNQATMRKQLILAS
jgi:V/A-type H+-transporting ATPase subunit C